MRIRIPYHDKRQRLDHEALWQLPQVLEDPEERALAREYLCDARAAGAKTVGEAIAVLERLDSAGRKSLFSGLRRTLGLAPKLPPVRGGSGWSPWQLCPICGCQPLDELTGAPRPVSVRRWYCEAHVDQAGPEDMQPMGSGIKIAPSGALVPVEPGEVERERIEAELRERRHQDRLAIRELEAEGLNRQREAEREELRRLTPPGIGP